MSNSTTRIRGVPAVERARTTPTRPDDCLSGLAPFADADHHGRSTMSTEDDDATAAVVSDDEIIERAAANGIPISPAAIRAEANKLLRRSGILEPTLQQEAIARRGAIESYLLDVKASREAS